MMLNMGLAFEEAGATRSETSDLIFFIRRFLGAAQRDSTRFNAIQKQHNIPP
jgi:hypothetical protein